MDIPETPQEETVPAQENKPTPTNLQAVGRRKESVARVRLLPGSGKFMVNKRALQAYFPRESLCVTAKSPLTLTREEASYDVHVNVHGGGLTGQAGAVRLGVARALASMDEGYHRNLRGAGMLTRDPRMKERKKYGQKGARKRFQWTKR